MVGGQGSVLICFWLDEFLFSWVFIDERMLASTNFYQRK